MDEIKTIVRKTPTIVFFCTTVFLVFFTTSLSVSSWFMFMFDAGISPNATVRSADRLRLSGILEHFKRQESTGYMTSIVKSAFHVPVMLCEDDHTNHNGTRPQKKLSVCFMPIAIQNGTDVQVVDEWVTYVFIGFLHLECGLLWTSVVLLVFAINYFMWMYGIGIIISLLVIWAEVVVLSFEMVVFLLEVAMSHIYFVLIKLPLVGHEHRS